MLSFSSGANVVTQSQVGACAAHARSASARRSRSCGVSRACASPTHSTRTARTRTRGMYTNGKPGLFITTSSETEQRKGDRGARPEAQRGRVLYVRGEREPAVRREVPAV